MQSGDFVEFFEFVRNFAFVLCYACIMSHSVHFQAGYVTLVDKVSVSSGRMKGFVFTK
jgi:hypothetical protein